MSIVRYDPFRDLRTLQEEVNRLFSTNLTRSFGDEGIGRGAWAPSVDIYENKDQIVLEHRNQQVLWFNLLVLISLSQLDGRLDCFLPAESEFV